jgi:hypothetical protein
LVLEPGTGDFQLTLDVASAGRDPEEPLPATVRRFFIIGKRFSDPGERFLRSGNILRK